MGKKTAYSKHGKDKKKPQGQKRKRFERDIRPVKKRKVEGSQKVEMTVKQMKKKFFMNRQFPQKEFEAKNIADENILKRIDVAEDENPHAQFVKMFGCIKSHGGKDDDDEESGREDVDLDSDEGRDDEVEEDGADDDEGEDGGDNDDEREAGGDDDDLGNDIEEEDEDAAKDSTVDPFNENFKRVLDVGLANKLLKTCSWKRESTELPFIGETMTLHHPVLSIPKLENMDITKSFVKLRLLKQFKKLPQKYSSFCPSKSSGHLTELQEGLFPIINLYKDLYFPNRTSQNADSLMFLYCLHALNHVSKTRNIIVKNNAKVKERIEKRKKKIKDIEYDDDELQDQGYARPKVLILVPFRSCVMKIVNIFIHLLADDKALVQHKIRFMEEYGKEENDDQKRGLKPEDFEDTFDGNTDEDFRIGISISKKAMKLYSNFYTSDIIIASTLGLKNVIELEEKGVKKAGDNLFLSSIEILIMDQTEVFQMQNWNNVNVIMENLNRQPSGKFATDISRIKGWYINGWASLYRQTLVFSGFQTPEVNLIIMKHSSNYRGKYVVPTTDSSSGTMSNIHCSIPQTFKRFTTLNYEDASDARFKFFTKRVLPSFRNSPAEHIIIFISSFYDFVRVRNYFKKEELKFEVISEGTRKEHISRSRQFFFEGRSKYLLYTERFHYYYRYFIRGIHHLVFYDLPINAQFYPEICNMVVDFKKGIVPVDTSCTALYSKFDALKLMRIAGSERTDALLNDDEDEFSFASVDN